MIETAKHDRETFFGLTAVLPASNFTYLWTHEAVVDSLEHIWANRLLFIRHRWNWLQGSVIYANFYSSIFTTCRWTFVKFCFSRGFKARDGLTSSLFFFEQHRTTPSILHKSTSGLLEKTKGAVQCCSKNIMKYLVFKCELSILSFFLFFFFFGGGGQRGTTVPTYHNPSHLLSWSGNKVSSPCSVNLDFKSPEHFPSFYIFAGNYRNAHEVLFSMYNGMSIAVVVQWYVDSSGRTMVCR